MRDTMMNNGVRFTLSVLISTIVFNWGYAQSDSLLKYSLKTRWSAEVDPNKVWTEYPRPQMTRENYHILNGMWEYAIQPKGNNQLEKVQGKILVPFAAESELSGVKKIVGEHNYLWYKRAFKSPKLARNERLLLHFGAVDWEAKIFINHQVVGIHKGGFDAFSFDITDYLRQGDQELIVRVWDPSDKGTQPRGKQVSTPQGIWYTPVTGIWQTVWLEKVPHSRIDAIKTIPDIDNRNLKVNTQIITDRKNFMLRLSALNAGKVVADTTISINDPVKESTATLRIPNPRLWSPDDPFLYDLKIELLNADGKIADRVGSYFGMRKISLGKDAKGYTRIMLNNKPLFQFGLLDQGWWPDGLYTPPSEEAMRYDVEVTKNMGFNMLRKHVKVECARFYYHCDKMGMLVWQDMPNGNYFKDLRIEAWEPSDAQRTEESSKQFEYELKRMMDQFANHPSILVWVPFNEGWGQYDTKRVTEWVKQYDPSRLVDSPSGWTDRGAGDIIDIHLYPGPGMEAAEKGRAAVVGEFGGLGYPVKDHLWWDKRNWGYLTYDNKEKFTAEFEKLMLSLRGLVGNGLSAAIYTQTTDVEGEVNGLITYDREVVKIAPENIRNMIMPLYEDYWDTYFFVRDAEHEPTEWRVSASVPSGDWTSPEYDDFKWTSQKAPLSTFNNFFLDNATRWNKKDLFLRKEFEVSALPDRIYLKHYMAGAKAKVYLNGKVLLEHEDKGGRKRHYTNIDISDHKHLLTNGKNVLSVALISINDNASFDIGLYTTSEIQNNHVEKASIRTSEMKQD
jgi:hypothetical protein